MLKKLIENSESKIILLFSITTAIIYCFFWIGYYYLSFEIAIGLVVTTGLLYAVFHRSSWASMVFVFGLSLGIGIIISTFFTMSMVVPSRFFGVVLLIMLAYKIVQVILGSIIKNRKLYYIFFIICLIIELIALIWIGVVAYLNTGLYWQIFFALMLCFFYSCSQIYLRKQNHESLWKNAAIAYLLGFVLIFVLVVLLILSILSEDGELLGEFVGDGIAGAVTPTGDFQKKRPKK